MIITCPECGLAYDPGIGHFCSIDIRKRVEKLEKTIEYSTIGALLSQITELQGDVAQFEVYLEDERKNYKQLRNHLFKYGRHNEDCNPVPWGNTCKCGFRQMLRGV